MKIAEIHRDLNSSDPKVKIWIQRLQEQCLEMQSQINQCADVLDKVVTTLQTVNKVNLELNDRWNRMIKGRSDDESMVQSVIPDTEH